MLQPWCADSSSLKSVHCTLEVLKQVSPQDFYYRGFNVFFVSSHLQKIEIPRTCFNVPTVYREGNLSSCITRNCCFSGLIWTHQQSFDSLWDLWLKPSQIITAQPRSSGGRGEVGWVCVKPRWGPEPVCTTLDLYLPSCFYFSTCSIC